MNDIIRAMIERRSIRKFRPDMPPERDIEEIVQAGLCAASSRGKQGTVIIPVTNREWREKLVRDNRTIGGWEGDFDPFYGAPVILIVLGDKSSANRVYDGSLVMGNLMLAAHSLGLGSIWIHRAKEEFEDEFGKNILKKLGIPDEYEGIGHCALGYAAEELPAPAPRKENYVHYI